MCSDSLRLAVKVGSIAEADNECGVAHFIEHMCFNGTEHFEKNSAEMDIEELKEVKEWLEEK